MVKILRRNRSYGLTQPLNDVPSLPIVAQRAPTTRDQAEIGQLWIDSTANVAYVLVAVAAGSSTWASSPAAGATTLASLTVNPGNATITAGNLTVSAGDLDVTVGNVTIGGTLGVTGLTTVADLTATGTTTISGDLDLTSAALIDLTSTLNADPAILLRTNGGVLEVLRLLVSQGTSAASLDLESTNGGVTLHAVNNATADAINLEADAGGIDIDGALQINIDSSQAAATAIRLNTSNAAGGIDIDSGTGGTIMDSTGAISLDAAAASNFSVSGAGIDLSLVSAAGRVVVNGEEAAADAVRILSAAGGIDADAALQINISSSQNAADAIIVEASAGGIDILASGAAAGEDIDIVSTGSSVNMESTEADANAITIHASDAVGGVVVRGGTGGILIGTDADTTPISVGDIAPTASRTITVGGGTVVTAATTDTIDIGPDGATTNADSEKIVNVNTGGVTLGVVRTNIGSGNRTSGTHDVNVSTGTGTKTVNIGNADALTTVNIDGISLINDSINANTSINTGTSTGTVSIGNAAAGAISVDTAAGISLDAATASNFTVTGAAVDLTLSSVGGSVNVDSTENAAQAIYLHANGGALETIDIHSDQGTGVDSVTIQSDVGGVSISSGLASNDAINLIASGGGVDIDGALQVAITSSQNAASAVVIEASAGGIDLLASGAAAGEDIDIIATGSSVNITSTEAVADAIVLNSSNAAGGIDLLTGGGEISLNSGGNITMTPGTATVAGTSLTLNARVGVATFTGLTTASGANEDFTITNSFLGAGDGVFVTVSNLGTNDADMSLEGVITQTAGTLTVHTQNNGPAALNGDVVISFWIIN